MMLVFIFGVVLGVIIGFIIDLSGAAYAAFRATDNDDLRVISSDYTTTQRYQEPPISNARQADIDFMVTMLQQDRRGADIQRASIERPPNPDEFDDSDQYERALAEWSARVDNSEDEE